MTTTIPAFIHNGSKPDSESFSTVGGGLTAFSTGYVVGVAVLLILMAGVQGRSWAIWANVGVQLLLVAGWAIYPGVGFIGLLFLLVWLLIAYLRAEVLRRQRRGLLPGQRRDDEPSG